MATDPLSRCTCVEAQEGEEFCLKGTEGRKHRQLTQYLTTTTINPSRQRHQDYDTYGKSVAQCYLQL